MTTNIDKPFFEKFNSKSVFFESKDDFYHSIMTEIANILSSRLKIKDNLLKLKDFPFSYGIRDFQSVNSAENSLRDFKEHCRNMILKNEPRISDIEIDNLIINNEKQSIELNFLVYVGEDSFEEKILFRS